MIDLEEQIRASLRGYGDRLEPREPVAPFVPVSAAGTRRGSTAGRWLAAAAVVIGLVVGLAVVVGWSGRTPVAPAPSGPGTWRVTAAMPLSPRKTPSVLWTGTEFIVWGGESGNVGFRDGARYDPQTDTWRPMAMNDRVRGGGGAVWAGDRMVVLSGAGGEAYDPVTDTWTSMPGLPANEATPGFSDAVYVGGTLLGVGIWQDPDEPGATRIRVWKFDDARQQWFSQSDALVVTVFPGPLVSVEDQFTVHQLVPLSDGFAVWDGGRIVFVYGPGASRTISSDRWFVDGVQPVAFSSMEGRPAMLATRQTADAGDLRLSTFADGVWSPWTVLGGGGLGISRPVPVGDDLVVLGFFLLGNVVPTHIDLGDGTASPMTGYPISTVIDQGGAWSGDQLLVCGGQRSTDNTSEISTDDPGPVSAECALWTP